MSEGDDSEKTHDATPHKIEQARKNGDIARSNDVSAAAAYAGLFIAFSFVGIKGISQGAGVLGNFIGQADRISATVLGPGGQAVSASIIGQALVPLIPVFLLPFIAVLLALLGQRVFIVSPDKIMPKLSRISPVQGVKNKFGAKGLVEFLKTLAKMLAVAIAVGLYLRTNQSMVIGSLQAQPATVASLMGRVLSSILLIVVAIATVVAIVDFLWQKFHHLQKLRMSFQEVKDEAKQAEGDPHMKQQRRARAQEIATNQMLHDVPNANVVIVNPTHYAVALEWNRAAGTAPVCVAKGVDDVARRIREVATDAGVPIHSDPPTARAIHATIELGHEIDPDHYRAVAAAIRFAEAMRLKARERDG